MFGWDGGRDQAVYEDQLGRNASMSRKLSDARIAQLQQIALDSIAADDSMPALDRNVLLGRVGADYANMQLGNLRGQERGFRDDVFNRADAAGYGPNAGLFALADRPVEVNKALAGGLLRGDTYRPGGELAVTDLGIAEMFKDRSAGQANLARAALYGERATNPERFRAPPRPGGGGAGVYTIDEALDAVEYNRMAERPGSGMTPIPVPVPGTPRGAAAPTSTSQTPSSIPVMATNPATGEVLELRNGQWVKVE
ncbi:MAG: hypothetical protein C0437_07865 [Ralstonia sp.]|nr:hypothetical protein [Ralstonia sp.]